MADDDDDDEDEEEGSDDEDGEEGASKKGGKGKLLIIVGVALLLVVGGAAAAYFTGLLDSLVGASGGGAEGSEESADSGIALYYDLPELLVNLNTSDRKQVFLKMRITLELRNPQDVPTIEGMMPRIIDNFQVYVRELRLDDLKGSAGMYRLRENFLTRMTAAAAPIKINDVLFKDFLIQ